jgi:hypothetical protein
MCRRKAVSARSGWDAGAVFPMPLRSPARRARRSTSAAALSAGEADRLERRAGRGARRRPSRFRGLGVRDAGLKNRLRAPGEDGRRWNRGAEHARSLGSVRRGGDVRLHGWRGAGVRRCGDRPGQPVSSLSISVARSLQRDRTAKSDVEPMIPQRLLWFVGAGPPVGACARSLGSLAILFDARNRPAPGYWPSGCGSDGARSPASTGATDARAPDDGAAPARGIRSRRKPSRAIVVGEAFRLDELAKGLQRAHGDRPDRRTSDGGVCMASGASEKRREDFHAGDRIVPERRLPDPAARPDHEAKGRGYGRLCRVTAAFSCRARRARRVVRPVRRRRVHGQRAPPTS